MKPSPSRYLCLSLLCSLWAFTASAGTWPQAAGPNANWKVEGDAATHWSLVLDQNIKWRTSLPEGGQSAVTLYGDYAFLTTYRPLQSSTETTSATDIVGYCLDASNGAILWTVELPGSDPVGTAGIFSDATVFAPISDGQNVWFFNRSGSIGCYDMNGKPVWLREYAPRTRHTNRQSEPILFENQLLVVEVLDKEAAKQLKRHQAIPEGVDPKSVWTYVHAIDAQTGALLWTEPAGTVIHNTPMIGRRSNGAWALLHARGGPHAPLETPYGLSLSSLNPKNKGAVLWSSEIPKLNPMLNNHWDAARIYTFAGEDHLILDTETGDELSRRSLRKNVDRWSHDASSDTWNLQSGIDLNEKKPRLITYHTNIIVGHWHYFLSHEQNAIARVNTRNDKVEYLEVPLQISVSPDGLKTQIWKQSDAIPNTPENARGINLSNDKRSLGSGWGHVSAASPILVGRYLYFPVLSGTVYVIDTQATTFSDKALVAINDLGPAGSTWSLSSFSYADQKLYARTLKEVICIQKQD